MKFYEGELVDVVNRRIGILGGVFGIQDRDYVVMVIRNKGVRL